MAAPHAFDILPVRGQYFLLDKSEGVRVSRVKSCFSSRTSPALSRSSTAYSAMAGAAESPGEQMPARSKNPGAPSASWRMKSPRPLWARTPAKVRMGSCFLLDKSEGVRVSRVIFQTPTAQGKGVLVAPTVHGNLLAGTDAEPL